MRDAKAGSARLTRRRAGRPAVSLRPLPVGPTVSTSRRAGCGASPASACTSGPTRQPNIESAWSRMAAGSASLYGATASTKRPARPW